jgi:hypothetical protein
MLYPCLNISTPEVYAETILTTIVCSSAAPVRFEHRLYPVR